MSQRRRWRLAFALLLGHTLAANAASADGLQVCVRRIATAEQVLDTFCLTELQQALLSVEIQVEQRDLVVDALRQRVGWDVDALGFAWTIDMVARRDGKAQRFGTLPEREFPAPLRGKDRHQYAARQENLGLLHALPTSTPKDVRPLAMVPIHPPRNMARRQAWLTLMQRDQTARQSGADLQAVDEALLPALRTLLREAGFPTRDAVGLAGVEAAFVLVQHASGDPQLMLDVLKHLRPRAMQGEFSRVHLALLEDRVRILYQRPQWYGTQTGRDASGPFTYPIEQIEHVNARRRSMRLGPLSDEAMAHVRWPQGQ